MKDQAEKCVARMLKGWASTRDLIDASGSLTPLARLAEWREENGDYYFPKGEPYSLIVFTIHGKMMTEDTRTRKILNRDGKAVTITERKLVKVK